MYLLLVFYYIIISGRIESLITERALGISQISYQNQCVWSCRARSGGPRRRGRARGCRRKSRRATPLASRSCRRRRMRRCAACVRERLRAAWVPDGSYADRPGLSLGMVIFFTRWAGILVCHDISGPPTGCANVSRRPSLSIFRGGSSLTRPCKSIFGDGFRPCKQYLFLAAKNSDGTIYVLRNAFYLPLKTIFYT